MAQALFLSAWQDVQGLGILYLSVIRWSYECERVRTHEDAGDLGLDFWHVAGHAGAALGTVLMMRVLGQRCFARTVAAAGSVAIEADFVHRFAQLRVILWCRARRGNRSR